MKVINSKRRLHPTHLRYLNKPKSVSLKPFDHAFLMDVFKTYSYVYVDGVRQSIYTWLYAGTKTLALSVPNGTLTFNYDDIIEYYRNKALGKKPIITATMNRIMDSYTKEIKDFEIPYLNIHDFWERKKPKNVWSSSDSVIVYLTKEDIEKYDIFMRNLLRHNIRDILFESEYGGTFLHTYDKHMYAKAIGRNKDSHVLIPRIYFKKSGAMKFTNFKNIKLIRLGSSISIDTENSKMTPIENFFLIMGITDLNVRKC